MTFLLFGDLYFTFSKELLSVLLSYSQGFIVLRTEVRGGVCGVSGPQFHSQHSACFMCTFHMWHIRCVWSLSMILKAVRPVFFVAVFWVAESFFFLIEPSSSVHHPEHSVTIIESEQEKRLWECFMSWRVCVCVFTGTLQAKAASVPFSVPTPEVHRWVTQHWSASQMS